MIVKQLCYGNCSYAWAAGLRLHRGCSTIVNITDFAQDTLNYNGDENQKTAQPKNSRYSILNKTHIKILTATGVDDSVQLQRTMY